VGDGAVLASSRLIAGGALVIAAVFFFDAILGEAGSVARARRRRTVVVGAAVAVIGATPLAREIVVNGVLAVIVLAVLAERAFAVLRRAWEVESNAERTRLRYLGYGGIGALLGYACDLASLAGWHVPAVGGLLVAVYLYFISQALLLQRLLDLHELLGKALVFGTLALLLALVYGLLYVWVGERRGLFLSNTLVASSLILILFEPLKTYLEETATRVFFREHLTFARSLRRLVRDLATVIELPQAIDTVLDELYDSKRATHTSIYLLDQDGMGFVLQGHRGPRPTALLEGKAHPVVFAHLMKAQTPLLREAVARRLGEAKSGDALTDGEQGDQAKQKSLPQGGPALDEALLRGLEALKADLVVPIRSGNAVVGLTTLKDERLSEAYASDEIAALIEVADQLAITVENSRLFGLLRERDRLAALGEMSAGLAHEIRNPLAAIKGAAQELDPRRIGGDDGELMQIIIDEVDRLNSVVTEFLDYARPFRGTFIPLSVNDAVKKTAQLMKQGVPHDVELEVALEDGLPDVNGDAERLQQVLINLILNAADAMGNKGKITLSTAAAADTADAALLGLKDRAQFVEVRVRDTGPGIPQKVLEQIFIPFYTTKPHGTGLGLALCQRIVQHHGGNIEVRSSEGRGTTFIVRLPSLGARKSAPPLDVETAAG
jgi:two-component system, NtrC family, sensor histidine kinase HydH